MSAHKSRLLAWIRAAGGNAVATKTIDELTIDLKNLNMLERFYTAYPEYRPA